MIREVVVVTLIFLLASCSNLTKNLVKDGDFVIKSGRANGLEWSESLKLQRVSWYSQFTLLYDVIYGELPRDSKFQKWFSAEEIRKTAKCKRKVVALRYAADKRITHQMFNTAARKSGYGKMTVPDFEKSMRSHPDFTQYLLSSYAIDLFCGDEIDSKISVSYPNFEEKKL
ncbi:MAG: hypothetical protein VX341_07675 [Bdellovibrionota bacterium]|nr:hypothetical protein [Bdellovibrionota bacterium]